MLLASCAGIVTNGAFIRVRNINGSSGVKGWGITQPVEEKGGRGNGFSVSTTFFDMFG